VSYWNVPRLKSQLLGLGTSGSGKDSIDYGPRGHDDVINAAAGALGMALASGGYALFPVEGEDEEEDEASVQGRRWVRPWDR